MRKCEGPSDPALALVRSPQRPTGSYCSLGECRGLRRPEPRITEVKACKSARVQAIQPSHSLRSHQRPTGSYCSLGECSGLRRPEPRITEVKACKSARVQAIQPSLLYARPKDRPVLTCHLSDCRGLRTGLNEDPVVLGCTSVALRTAGRSWRSSAENRWPDPKRKRPPRKCEAAFLFVVRAYFWITRRSV